MNNHAHLNGSYSIPLDPREALIRLAHLLARIAARGVSRPSADAAKFAPEDADNKKERFEEDLQ